jgi:hypothetical protein
VRQGTPLGGRNRYLSRTLLEGEDCTLIAYTNTQDSLGNSTAPGDLTQPNQANGYAPITLPKAGWTISNGIATYAQPPAANFDADGNPCWIATGSWSAGVAGAALIQNGAVLHFYDHRDGNGDPLTFTAQSGRKFVVDLSALTG